MPISLGTAVSSLSALLSWMIRLPLLRRITAEILDYIRYAKEKGCSMQGTEDPAVEHLNVLVDDRQVWK